MNLTDNQSRATYMTASEKSTVAADFVANLYLYEMFRFVHFPTVLSCDKLLVSPAAYVVAERTTVLTMFFSFLAT